MLKKIQQAAGLYFNNFLGKKGVKTAVDERLAGLAEKARRLPLTAGVYIMKDKSGKIIYIGKAKALRNRVSQYFGSQSRHTDKVRRMVECVESFDYILCSNEFEALMLECSLIKQHMPKYNILLKDAKGFHYIRVTKPPYRTVKAVKQQYDDGADYIGPFYSSYSVSQSVDAACKAFCLPRCSKSGKDMGKRRGRPCLNYHIGQCSAPCCSKISLSDYEESVDAALDFLRDGTSAAVSALTKQMNDAAEKLEFERAARLRDRINALSSMTEKQKVVSAEIPMQDVIALAQAADKCCFEVFVFRDSRLCDSRRFIVDGIFGAEQARADFIMQLYSSGGEIPPRISVDGEVADREIIERALSEKRGKKCVIAIPKRSEQKALVELCRQNAAEYLAEAISRKGHQTAGADELARLLGLAKPPELIEAYDISHTAGDETVAGMVVFKGGVPYKAGYRRFKIENYQNDDCASMRQTLSRRLNEYEAHSQAGDGDYFATLPDLILLDGGKQQVSAVRELFSKRGYGIAVFGLVKDSRHRTRAVTSDGDEIAIKATLAAYRLCYQIQEEVHRFAVGYHNKRRKRKMLGSSLTAIEGVGEARAKQLMLHFGTVGAVASAELEDLMRIRGLTEPVAKRIYEHFHPDALISSAKTVQQKPEQTD